MEKLKGYILWFDQRDGNGIVKDNEGIQYYIDSSAIESDLYLLKSGKEVEFVLNTEIKHINCGKDVKVIL